MEDLLDYSSGEERQEPKEAVHQDKKRKIGVQLHPKPISLPPPPKEFSVQVEKQLEKLKQEEKSLPKVVVHKMETRHQG